MKKLTGKQQKALDYIRSYQFKSGKLPTGRHIAVEIGNIVEATGAYYLRLLKDRGLVISSNGKVPKRDMQGYRERRISEAQGHAVKNSSQVRTSLLSPPTGIKSQKYKHEERFIQVKHIPKLLRFLFKI